MNDQIVVAGGLNDQGKHMSNVTAYDPLSNSWPELTPLPTPRSSGVAGSIGNQIFYTTGAPNFTTTYKSVFVNSQTSDIPQPNATSGAAVTNIGNSNTFAQILSINLGDRATTPRTLSFNRSYNIVHKLH